MRLDRDLAETGCLKHGSDGAGVRERNGVGSSHPSSPAARRGSRSSSFSSSVRQQTKASRPEGFIMRRKFENAATGSGKPSPEARKDTIDAAFGKCEPLRIAFP